MARDSATYRGARRNYCIREQHQMWSSDWYYKDHLNAPDWAVRQGMPRHNKKAIYVPALHTTRKAPTSKGSIHAMLRAGNYAAAVRAFFGRWKKSDANRDQAEA